MELNYFPSNLIGQWVIGDFQLALTNSIVDPNTPELANITTYHRHINWQYQHQNGTVVQCHGDEPGERMSL